MNCSLLLYPRSSIILHSSDLRIHRYWLVSMHEWSQAAPIRQLTINHQPPCPRSTSPPHFTPSRRNLTRFDILRQIDIRLEWNLILSFVCIGRRTCRRGRQESARTRTRYPNLLRDQSPRQERDCDYREVSSSNIPLLIINQLASSSYPLNLLSS